MSSVSIGAKDREAKPKLPDLRKQIVSWAALQNLQLQGFRFYNSAVFLTFGLLGTSKDSLTVHQW